MDHEKFVEAVKRDAEKMAFHQLEIGEIFHDGFYGIHEFMVLEKISKSKAKVVEVHPPDSKPRMIDSVHHFGSHHIIWKMEE